MSGQNEMPRLRIVTGSAALVELEVNQLLDNYAVLTWNFAVVKDELRMTAVLVAQSEIRKQALIAQPIPTGLRRQ